MAHWRRCLQSPRFHIQRSHGRYTQDTRCRSFLHKIHRRRRTGSYIQLPSAFRFRSQRRVFSIAPAQEGVGVWYSAAYGIEAEIGGNFPVQVPQTLVTYPLGVGAGSFFQPHANAMVSLLSLELCRRLFITSSTSCNSFADFAMSSVHHRVAWRCWSPRRAVRKTRKDSRRRYKMRMPRHYWCDSQSLRW